MSQLIMIISYTENTFVCPHYCVLILSGSESLYRPGQQKIVSDGRSTVMESQLQASVDSFAKYIREQFTGKDLPQVCVSLDRAPVVNHY